MKDGDLKKFTLTRNRVKAAREVEIIHRMIIFHTKFPVSCSLRSIKGRILRVM